MVARGTSQSGSVHWMGLNCTRRIGRALYDWNNRKGLPVTRTSYSMIHELPWQRTISNQLHFHIFSSGPCCRKSEIAWMVEILRRHRRHILKLMWGARFDDKSARDYRKQTNEAFNCESGSNHLGDEFLACWGFRLFQQHRHSAVIDYRCAKWAKVTGIDA
jgi:hypothetical protein